MLKVEGSSPFARSTMDLTSEAALLIEETGTISEGPSSIQPV